MNFEIRVDVPTLAQAVDSFNVQYHQDYFEVRHAATGYLAGAPTSETAGKLAVSLLNTLESWGAGKRQAPACLPLAAAVEALLVPATHGGLKDLACSFRYLQMVKGARQLKAGGPFATVAEFDRTLIGTLNTLATGLMAGNTNVTYPMKALLLITGLMPAYDSQVRGGLAVAGISGVNRTRYLLPAEESSDAKKICVLPFLLADLVMREHEVLDKAVSSSRYPMLEQEYGRLFDILLFLQRTRTPETAFISFVNGAGKWFAI
jgi:hypothetical protein